MVGLIGNELSVPNWSVATTVGLSLFLYNLYSLYLFFSACCKAKYYGFRDTSPLTYHFYLNECCFSLIFSHLKMQDNSSPSI